jgi:diacylglycerol kinase (ATP)
MVGVVFNSNAGRGRATALRTELERRLEEAFPDDWALAPTERAGDGGRQTARLLDAGATRIASAGGDGTLSECLAALMDTRIPLAVIPVGTGNDFGRQVGIRTLDEAIWNLRDDNIVDVDVGLAGGKPFLDTLACGFDSAVGQRANEGFRYLKGTAAYVGAIASTLRRYEAVEMEVNVDGKVWSGRAMLAAICNCRSYGGGFQVAPEASITDGLLDVVVVERMSKARFVCQLPKVMKGRHMSLPEVHHWTGKSVKLSVYPPIRWMLDGELQGDTPVQVEIAPARRPMVIPASDDAFEPL